ncbi:hypothetical protein F5Y12DRAFT_749749 [Xylaria sp. FL1777]|nr:hypothetical protein F5Y12DRAFT_749749 [Xylaria sp. FL1777]
MAAKIKGAIPHLRIMAWLSTIFVSITVIGPLVLRYLDQETQAEAPAIIDTPAEQVQHDEKILELERQETSSGTTEHRDETVIEAPTGETEQKKPTHANRCVRFVENLPRCRDLSPQRKTTTDEDRTPTVSREAHGRGEGTQISGRPISWARRVLRARRCAERDINWEDNNSYSEDEYEDDDSSDETAVTERHILEDYPCVDESTFLFKEEVETPARPRRSLLTELLPGYAELIETDGAMAVEIQAAIERQCAASRNAIIRDRQLKAEGEKTRIPVHLGGPAERLEIEETATF